MIAPLRAPLAVACLALSTSCAGPAPREPAEERPSVIPKLVARGEVVGPFALHRPDATVRLVRLDGGGATSVVDERKNSVVTGFRVASGYSGPHRLEVTAPGTLPLSIPFDVGGEPIRFEERLRLAPASRSLLSGEVVSLDGAPPDREAAASLAAIPAVVSAWHDAGELRVAERRAAIDPNGRFAFEVPVGFDGVIELRCGRSLVESARWRSGDGPVRLAVDVDGLRRHVGAIDVLADRRLGVAIHRVGDPVRFPGLELVAEESGLAGRAVFDALWPGEYVVVAAPEDSSPSVHRVLVESGRTTTVPVAPTPRGRRIVRLTGGIPADMDAFAREVIAATPDGARLPVRTTPGAAPRTLVVEGEVDGETVLRWNGHALRLDAADHERAVEWALEPTWRAWLPIALARRLGSPRPETVEARIRMEAWNGGLVDEWWTDVELGAQGNGLAPLPFAPGRFVVRVDVPAADHRFTETAWLGPTDHDQVLLFGDSDW
ncbi:MAG: hypothetical protein ACF8XB_08915 [Planctomycetota bacterium JB042]